MRQVRTRSALRSALLELAQEMPFADITVGDIVVCGRVSPATFYRHYKDKNALLADVARDFTAELARQITPEAVVADSRDAALSLCKFLEEHRAICAALLSRGVKSAIFEQILEHAVSHSEASGIAEEIWLPQSLGPVYMVTAILTLVGWWLHRGADMTANEMSLLIDRLVFTPVLSDRFLPARSALPPASSAY